MNLLDRITEICRRVFNDPELIITNDTNASSIPGWDSVSHIALIVELEEAFNITFPTYELAKLVNVSTIISILESKGIE